MLYSFKNEEGLNSIPKLGGVKNDIIFCTGNGAFCKLKKKMREHFWRYQK